MPLSPGGGNQFQQVAIAAPIDELVTLPEGLLERKSSVRTMRRKVKFIDCLGEEVVQMGEARVMQSEIRRKKLTIL